MTVALRTPHQGDLFGGSPKTATGPALRSMSGTIPPTSTATDGFVACLPARARRSSFGPLTVTPYLFGAGSGINPVRPVLTALYSETKVHISQASLSDRLTLSLITSGLVAGITPTSIRQLSGQPIRVLAFAMPDGGDVGLRPGDSLSSSGERLDAP